MKNLIKAIVLTAGILFLLTPVGAPVLGVLFIIGLIWLIKDSLDKNDKKKEERIKNKKKRNNSTF